MAPKKQPPKTLTVDLKVGYQEITLMGYFSVKAKFGRPNKKTMVTPEEVEKATADAFTKSCSGQTQKERLF